MKKNEELFRQGKLAASKTATKPPETLIGGNLDQWKKEQERKNAFANKNKALFEQQATNNNTTKASVSTSVKVSDVKSKFQQAEKK
jgi:hypothetical protein